MANTIKIKRSTSTAQPADSALAAGELAYSSSSGKLFIGHPDGSTAAPQHIGYLQPVEGTLTASKPIVIDSDSKIDRINVDNLLDGNTISSTDTNGVLQLLQTVVVILYLMDRTGHKQMVHLISI